MNNDIFYKNHFYHVTTFIKPRNYFRRDHLICSLAD